MTRTLDRPTPAIRPLSAAPTARAGRARVRSRLRRTPGRLALIMSLLIAAGLAAGLAGMVGVGQRVGLIEGVTARSGELAVATQRLYRALSDADATAASAFLSNGLEPAVLRERYQADIADAASALAVVSSGGVRRAQGAVATITTALPVYTGLIETARTYNRQGLPVGTAYLQEASGLMRGKLLPAAQELYDIVATELDEARDGASAFPWFALLLGLGTLGGLVWAQRDLTRRTNRVFNVGLVGATAAALLLVGWLGVSALSAAGRLDASRDDGSAQVNLLSKARIAALQARTDEALTLVARGNGAAFEEDYTSVMRRLIGEDGNGGLLAEGRARATDEATRQALASAAETARDWDAAHRELRELDGNGQYAEAVAAAVGAGDRSTASIFSRLDVELGRAIDHNGRRFDDQMARAGDRLFGADVAVGVLALLAVIGIAAGFQRRIVEYR